MSVEELQEYGLEKMSDTEIRNFLSSQKTGVLGLPQEDAPYLLPLTFGYDGETWRPGLFDTATLSGEVTVYEFSVDEQTGIKHQGLPPALETGDEQQRRSARSTAIFTLSVGG
ncbi:hypothetical protein [Natrinema sp. 1APR25-10V2]|uniref:pyridoxamine 5'-phosphate oxidase family protein n=1 Tax=Natrinema sp. 1APR25-10V2 TaxID=2951081 RepID=UPI00287490FA|nr:hypothetical protein [Natrinema sp. 1APR25-10V2]MDS0474437.1 hypothetical protein [Natrinema sp. 1APR25-10V2]